MDSAPISGAVPSSHRIHPTIIIIIIIIIRVGGIVVGGIVVGGTEVGGTRVGGIVVGGMLGIVGSIYPCSVTPTGLKSTLKIPSSL